MSNAACYLFAYDEFVPLEVPEKVTSAVYHLHHEVNESTALENVLKCYDIGVVALFKDFDFLFNLDHFLNIKLFLLDDLHGKFGATFFLSSFHYYVIPSFA